MKNIKQAVLCVASFERSPQIALLFRYSWSKHKWTELCFV
jgi:hypothetical protein